MSVLSRKKTVQWVEVGGTKVKLTDVGGRQSVRICTPANRAGDYEVPAYFQGRFKMTAAEVAKFVNVADLRAELGRRGLRSSRVLVVEASGVVSNRPGRATERAAR